MPICLKTPEARKAFAEKMSDKLTDDQKLLVKEAIGETDDVSKILTKGLTAKIATKALTIAGFVLGGLLAVHFAYKIDAKGNSFAHSISKKELERRAAANNGILTPYDMFGYASRPTNITESPIIASKILASLSEAVINPEYEKALNDESMKIKDWDPTKEELALINEEFQNTLDNLVLPEISLPQA